MARPSKTPRAQANVLLVVPPDGGYGWVVMVAAFFVLAILDGIMYSYGSYMLVLGDALGISQTQLTTITSVNVGMYYLTGPLSSALLNRFGFRIVGMFGALSAACGYAGASQSHSYLVHVVLYGAMGGFGAGSCYAAAVIIVGHYFDKYRALATSVALCGSAIGNMVVSQMLAYLIPQIGWQSTMLLQGGLVIVAFAMAILYRPLKPSLVLLHEGDKAGHVADDGTMLERMVELDEPTPLVDGGNQAKRRMSYAMSADTFTKYFQELDRAAQPRRQLPRPHRCCGHDCGWLTGCCERDTADDKYIRAAVLDRQDVFYEGSLTHLPRADASRHAQVAADHAQRVLASLELLSIDQRQKQPSSAVGGCRISCSALHRLVDVSLFGNCTFVVMSVACFVLMLSTMMPYLFLAQRSIDAGIPDESTESLIMFLALGNTFGRISCGLISLLTSWEAATLMGSSTIVAGLLTVLSAFVGVDNLLVQRAYAFVFGYMLCFSQSLRTVLFVQYLGLELLTTAFGLSSMVMGVAALIGPPLSGAILDATGSYMIVFVLCGLMFMLAGFLYSIVFLVDRWMNKTPHE